MPVTHVTAAKSASPEKAGARTPTALLRSKSMRQYQIQDYETDGATCPECGEQFNGRAGLSKHHSAQHGEKFKPLAACDRCGEIYTETVANINKNHNTYCSEDCRKRSFSEHRSGEQSAQYKPDVCLTCDECGDEFSRPPSEDHSRFCSWACYSNWREGKTFWSNGGKVSETCEWCGTEFKRYESHGNGRFCSPDCMHEWFASRTGQDHPLWKGGVDWYRAIRSAHGPTGWHTQREEHLGDECERCGASEETLSLHHIVPVLAGGLNAPWNYMTLCESCHPTVETYVRQFDAFDSVLTE